jgi:hypothetical protein
MRHISLLALAALLAVSCDRSSKPDYPYPKELNDYFGEAVLTRETKWLRDGTSAAVYVRDGQKMPGADLQVGVIVSYDKPTAKELHQWINMQAAQAEQRYYHDPTLGETCTVALANANPDTPRFFMALMSCKDNTDRAVCVQMDEQMTMDEWASCNGTDSCFSRACERKWADWGEEIEWLIADILTKR